MFEALSATGITDYGHNARGARNTSIIDVNFPFVEQEKRIKKIHEEESKTWNDKYF